MTLTAKALMWVMIVLLVLVLALFLPAGTIAWSAGWIFLILLISFLVAIIRLLFRHNPGLLEERMTMFKPDQKGWDKVLLLLFYILFLAWLVLMPLDAVRWRWSQMPVWFQVGGALVLLCSLALISLTFRENSYLSPTVRIQEDRGQTVVSTGPYQNVRHPLYSGMSLLFAGTALLLGSWYGLLLSPVLIGMLALRAVLEEHVLREELPGYDAYMTQVKDRFIPHVW